MRYLVPWATGQEETYQTFAMLIYSHAHVDAW